MISVLDNEYFVVFYFVIMEFLYGFSDIFSCYGEFFDLWFDIVFGSKWKYGMNVGYGCYVVFDDSCGVDDEI